jgi:two-component system response regulator FixJ
LTTVIHIIEDDPAIRDSLKLFLETRGYEVETFSSGAELLRNGQAGHCNCFILDVNLPGDNGFEVLKKLRSKGLVAPAIFMSGGALPDTRARAHQAKAVAYFDKPVPPAELLAAIDSATRHMA